jgi:hypothetical protein
MSDLAKDKQLQNKKPTINIPADVLLKALPAARKLLEQLQQASGSSTPSNQDITGRNK